ncbi:response regulator [Candidatus Formimonas warabiya]|uniref:Stage 0 sporulation protein A homolog n=1 Tax=Formimonas warabiya TaxID=1761012 RepID=A0A3G1KQP5_FORW1|nr:response regulator transcription factor [Candidatus Formimonas warabiya]ATW24778.1 DNA-binding response regulator [Candidatus Formimonas warabiya]
MTILVVDDETEILEVIKYNLERDGFNVVTCQAGKEAIRLVKEVKPDLIILDVMLPGMSGLEVCRYLRQNEATRKIPIVMISARCEEFDKVLGLEMGADDYVAKPFSPRELVARVKARLRAQNDAFEEKSDREQKIVRGHLMIDPQKYAVYVNDVKQTLTTKEFDLLMLLASNPGRVFSRNHLLEEIWGYDYHGFSRTVDVHIRHLRQKIGLDRGKEILIETVRGVGYRFVE